MCQVSANSSEVVFNCFEDRSVHSDVTRLLQSLSVGGPAFAGALPLTLSPFDFFVPVFPWHHAFLSLLHLSANPVVLGIWLLFFVAFHGRFLIPSLFLLLCHCFLPHSQKVICSVARLGD